MAVTSLTIDILKAWQRIEFFQPYAVEKKEKTLLISPSALRQSGDNALPWLSADLRQEYEIPHKASYCIHIGLFDKSVASRLSQEIFGAEQNIAVREEIEQRLDQEGTTCFAKVLLNADGAPAMDKLSVSSLPWALGHLQKRRFQYLSAAIFTEDCRHLADTLAEFALTLTPSHEKSGGVLRAADILTLSETHLRDWADFAPEWQYVLQIEWFESNGERDESAGEEISEQDEEASDNDKALALPILNSFFFEDLENVIRALEQKETGKALGAYLSGSDRRNVDLYSQDGLAAIIDKLHPANMPSGRWPSEPEHAMSLMQQFAINTAVEELADGGLLSVNGPPGTGKTTLLRDLVAHNVVERGTILSRFEKVEDTLDQDGFIVPALTGFEMVIASSNNAAVENISKELPQKKSLAKEFRALDYLAATANQLAAEYGPKRQRKKYTNSKGRECHYHLFRPLEEEKQCWGIISAALGKKSNRNKFTQRLFFDEHFQRDTPEETSRPETENFLSLWRWKTHHNAPSFTSAKKRFIACRQQTEKTFSQLTDYANLLKKVAAHSPDNLLPVLRQIEMQCEAIQRDLKLAEAKKSVMDQQVQHLHQQQKVLENQAPGWLSRLVKRRKLQEYRDNFHALSSQLKERLAQQIEHAQNIAAHQTKLNQSETLKDEIVQRIEQQARQQREDRHALQALQQQFPTLTTPDLTLPVNDATLQRVALWQNEEINRQRSLLFIAAIELHQAWLYEALDKKRLTPVISKFSNFLDKPHLNGDPLRWWQTLFMVVPVVSTTFASVGRMFHGVKGENLGWLMIDEAGQASPQQAVGAIWRAKRVVVVSDPLQIEPVFTTSPALVKHLCEDTLHDRAEEWNPAHFSVQQIADRANPWGCELEVMNQPLWIGIPLWVHRRCIEPMFSLANKMAYDNRMIHGLNQDEIGSQLVNNVIENHWVISSGGQGEKQYRDSHGENLIELLDRLLIQNVALQKIYIITPFKAVKKAITELLDQRDISTWRRYSPRLDTKEVNEWQKHSVGTVHTFQGKENDIVIFVLGCDEHDDGGAKWAASKPNLLNVALTRAKKHIFIIGDPKVWHQLPWFSDVAEVLPSFSTESHRLTKFQGKPQTPSDVIYR
ncbi:DEAD/DEAH box helicase [Erwinia oleae]|uniref:DEAD/DEAH box helicase n=1 Tax=Erwinia oleae TaxID=796334 RepID=UPI00068B0C12|nr:AAA domain-containing protein [Erwinia oleae]